MSWYAVIREASPGQIGDGIAAQPDVADHAAFMHGLADEGLVHFAGPLAGTENGRLRALPIVNADHELTLAFAWPGVSRAPTRAPPARPAQSSDECV